MDKKKFIAKTLDNIRKKSNFNYQKAITRNKNNPTTHARHKQIKEMRSKLSNDRFMDYLEEVFKSD
tara:strand:+ start:383 stop:580 length:198 start_codon:yes stop_codon:yes gene_type:complete